MRTLQPLPRPSLFQIRPLLCFTATKNVGTLHRAGPNLLVSIPAAFVLQCKNVAATALVPLQGVPVRIVLRKMPNDAPTAQALARTLRL